MVQGGAHAHGICVLVLEYLLFYDLGYWTGWVCIWDGRRRRIFFYALLGFNGAGQWDILTLGSGWAFFYT